MNNEQVMKIMEDLGLHEGGIENWIPDNAWVKVAEKVAAAEREACASVEVHLITPDREYTNMSPLDAYETALMDAAIAFREAIRARGRDFAHRQEWVGLTETEKEMLWDEAVEGREHFCSQYGDFADAIEAKLKEKNYERNTYSTTVHRGLS